LAAPAAAVAVTVGEMVEIVALNCHYHFVDSLFGNMVVVADTRVLVPMTLTSGLGQTFFLRP